MLIKTWLPLWIYAMWRRRSEQLFGKFKHMVHRSSMTTLVNLSFDACIFNLMKDNVGQWKWKINATHNIVTEMLHFQKHQLNEIPWN